MYSFIPSWYAGPGDWHTNIAPWYQPTQSYEFDDTVNQIRMFRNAGEDTELLCLAWSPNLRQFLHRQGLYPIPYWSAFDELQNVRIRKPAVFSYLELSWPEDVEWVYLPSRLMAYRSAFGKTACADFASAGYRLESDIDMSLSNSSIGAGAPAAAFGKTACADFASARYKYACVELTENGTLCWVEYYENGLPEKRDIYDDRGFCSASLFFQNGEEERQEFYDPEGRLRFTEDRRTGAVRISEEARGDFEKESYPSAKELIREKLAFYFRQHREREAVVIAANRQHDGMILQTLREVPGQRIVLSFFENRFDLQDEKALQEDTEDACLIVTDTEHTARLIEDAGVTGKNICDISPFDTRLSLGKSQRIRELKVFMPLDGLEGVLLEKALVQVFSYMQKNQDVVLLAGTKKDTQHEQLALKEKLEEVLAGMEERGLVVSVPWEQEEEAEEQENTAKKTARIAVTPYHSENDMIRILYDTRLILDVRDQPDLYLQIAGISAGIPQVNYRYTRYVKHRKDGYIIQNINYITGALEYYLDGLSGWNEALVYCVQEISRYTGGTLVEQWKQMIGEKNGPKPGTA